MFTRQRERETGIAINTRSVEYTNSTIMLSLPNIYGWIGSSFYITRNRFFFFHGKRIQHFYIHTLVMLEIDSSKFKKKLFHVWFT